MMTPERQKQIAEVFASAIVRAPEERTAFLVTACAGDEDLRSQVETLIASYGDNGDPFGVAAHLEPTVDAEPPVPVIGRRIGAYKVAREIGRGGMGAVYLAVRDDDEFQKRVAIKLIKRGMDTDYIVRRFRNERQILASLDHRYIARLLDGGTTEDGLPYFVMEYVEGQPLRHYCDAQKLTVAARLKLFRKVCSAVHYAHQNLIIHRDLKPSNILVAADGTPKLLDFGIAKILDPEFAGQALDPTTMSLLLMTPEYASPEQARGETPSAASDVYALGVILYELLTGRRPYRLRNRLPYEIMRVICEEEPERPSVAVNLIEVITTDGAEPIEVTPETVSRARSTTPEQLRRQLAGNLDNIIMKALRKEARQRYASAEELSEDLRRYLEGLPVAAPSYFPMPSRPEGDTDDPSTGSRSIAVLPFKVLRTEEKSDEYLGMGMADAIITRLSNIRRIMVRPTSAVFKYFDGEHNAVAAGYELNVGYVLDGRIQRVGDRVRVTVQLVRVRDGTPLWAATLDEHFTDIFALEDSLSQQVAQALVPRLTGEERELLLKRGTENPDAWQAYLQGRYSWNKFSGEGLGRSLEYFREAIRLDPEYALAYVGVADYFNWAAIYGIASPQECFSQAKTAALKALAIDDQLAEAHAALAFTSFSYDWDAAAAEQGYRRALELNPNYGPAYHWYASLLTAQGRFDEALAEIRRAQEVNPLSLMEKATIGWTYYHARQYDRAVQELQATLAMEPTFSPACFHLVMAYERLGRYEEAIAMAEKLLAVEKGSPVPLWVLGYTLAVAGRRAEAQKVLARVEKLSQESYISPYYFAMIYAGLGERDAAFEWFERAYESRDQWLVWLGTEPKLDDLRADPRFDSLLRRVGIVRDDLQTSGRETEIEDESASSSSASSASSSSSGATRKSPAIVTASVRKGARQYRKAWITGLVSLLVLAAVGHGIYSLIGKKRNSTPFQTTSAVKLTATGNTTSAALSPDGKYLAFAMEEAGKEGLWVRQVAVANSARIVAPVEGDYRGLTFSRDGNFVYYVVAERATPHRAALYQVPTFGGSATKIKDGVDSPVGLSPDGKRLAFVRDNTEQGEDALLVANADGSQEQLLATRKFPEHFSLDVAPAWSPDGKTIGCAVETADEKGFHMQAVAVQTAGGAEKLLSAQRWVEVGQMAWLADGSGLMMAGQDPDTSFVQLWHLPYPEGQPRKITGDLSDYRGVSLSADSSMLVSVQRQALTNIWITARGELDQLTQITSGGGRYFDLAWTPDGKLLYASDATGSADIWEMEAGGTEQRQLTAGAGKNYAPAISPDGRYVVFHSNRTGHWNIWRMDRDGSNPTPLTVGDEDSNWPQVSPDGRWVVYEHVGSGTLATVWKVPIAGGPPVRLTGGLSTRPAISPDGKWIACWQKEETPNAPWRIAIVPFEGGQSVKFLDVPQNAASGNTPMRWTADGRGVVYVDFRNGVTNLLRQPLDGGPAEALTHFTKDLFYSFDLGRDGRLALSRGLRTHDAVLIREAK